MEIINNGLSDNDPNADTLRIAFGKANANFEELYGFANNRVVWRPIGLIPGDGPATPQNVADKITTAGIFLPVGTISAPVVIEVLKFTGDINYKYLFLFTSGKGDWGFSGTPVLAHSFKLISIARLTPEDVEKDPNAVIENLDPVVDGDFVSKANQTVWDFSDSPEQQEDGGVKSYYFTYTNNSKLNFALFNGTPGVYGDLETPFTGEMFVITTNSNATPLITHTSQLTNDGSNGIDPFATVSQLGIERYGLTENPPLEINTSTWDGFPMIHQTKSGKILLIHKSGLAHGGAGSSGIRTSVDGGKTFSEYTPLMDEPGKYNGISGGGITPYGRIVLFYFIATPGVGTNKIGYFYSDDDAVTWSNPTTMPMGVNTGGGWTGKMITISQGKLMQCWWGADGVLDQPGTTNTLYAVFSTDNGSTWGNQVIIGSGNYVSETNYTEASFVYLQGGAIVGLVRKDSHSYYSQFKSEDNGDTWTNQGLAITVENMDYQPGAPELQTYIDLDGKTTVIAYFSNRTELNVKSILGRNLLSGISGWLPSTKTIIRSVLNGDSGYPSVIHPNGSRYGLGVFYESKSTSDSDIQFFKSTPIDNLILPNSNIKILGSITSTTLVNDYILKNTNGELVASQINDNNTTVNINKDVSNTYGRVWINDGVDINLVIKNGQTNPLALMFNFVNDALTANIDAEFRAKSFQFNKPLSVPDGVVPGDTATVGQIPKILRLTQNIDFPNLGSHSYSDFEFDFSGAVIGDCVDVFAPIALNLPKIYYTAWVSAAGKVTVRVTNTDTPSVIMPAGDFKIRIIK